MKNNVFSNIYHFQNTVILQANFNKFNCCLTNPIDPTSYALDISIRIAIIKKDHPNWSQWRCYLEAHWDLIHFGLDILGMIPVGGEVFDVVNGIIYTVQGDGVNASLSFAGAVPIVGWGATGAKWAMITIALANGKNIKLVLKNINGIIDFGNRSQLREVLQITSSSLQAHHIIPWALGNHKIVQNAAKSRGAFHMNELLNGLPIASWRNQPNHNVYNDLIKSKLDALPTNLSPNDAYN